MRPNLMSPRRVSTSGEDSILALLEREPARKRKAGASGARLAWYGASATVAMALTGTLVWMAANNDGTRPETHDAVLSDAGTAPPAMPTAGATIVQVAMAPAGAAPDVQPRTSAVIVDQPPVEAAPPLRLLKPAPDKSTPETATPAARAVARNAAPPRPAVVTPPGPKPAARPAAAAPVKPKPVVVARNAVRPAPSRARHSANPGKAADGSVDPDVALISAVIVHANGHAPENSQMTELLCPNDNCKARPPRQ